jgi:hypothetical protein
VADVLVTVLVAGADVLVTVLVAVDKRRIH